MSEAERAILKGLKAVVLTRRYSKGYIVGGKQRGRGPRPVLFSWHYRAGAALRAAEERRGILYELETGLVYKPTISMVQL